MYEQAESLKHNSFCVDAFKFLFDKHGSFISRFASPKENEPEKYVSPAEKAQELLQRLSETQGAATNTNEIQSQLEKSGLIDDLEQLRFLPNTTLVFNMSNEPCLKYSLNIVADQGVDMKTCTSFRLRNEVVFMESASERYDPILSIF